jgi:hypothetical protein
VSDRCCPHCEPRRIALEALTATVDTLTRRIDALETAGDDRRAQAKLLGAQGGKARKAALTVDERKALARHAAQARWRKPR